MKIGNWILIAGLAYVAYEVLFNKKDASGTNTSNSTGSNTTNLGEPQYNEQGQRIPYFYATVNSQAAIYMLGADGKTMQQMKQTLMRGEKVAVMDELGGYWKVDCDGLYVKKIDVTRI